MPHGARNFPEAYVPRAACKVVSPPTVEPVSLEEVKAELGLYSGDADQRLTRMIRAARELAEAYTGRAFITQELEMQLDTFPSAELPWWDGVRSGARRALTGDGYLRLMRPPTQDVMEIRYYDSRDAEHVVDPATYYLDELVEPNRILLAEGATWPIDPRRRAAVTIKYIAGYGDHPQDVPVLVAEAILAHVRDSFDRPNAGVSTYRIDNASTTYGALRTGVAAGTGGPSPTGGLRADAAAILAPLRVLEPV